MDLNRYFLVTGDKPSEFMSHGVFIVGMDGSTMLRSWLEWNDVDGPRSYRETCHPSGTWVGPATAARKQLIFHVGGQTSRKYRLLRNIHRRPT